MRLPDQRQTIRWIASGLAGILVACVIGLFLIFTSLREPVGTPQKPSRIPETAVWYPGEQGGSWIELVETRDSDFRLRIYQDFSGDLRLDSWFSLTANCRELHFSAPDFHRFVRGYDGTAVQLTTQEGRQDCQLKQIFPESGVSGTRVVYELDRKEVSQEVFDKLKASLEISKDFRDGEAVQGGKHRKDPHKTGTVHLRDARDSKTGTLYQYSISSFEDRTVYSISKIKRRRK